MNTVLRNLVYKPGDVIIYFSTIYGACEKTAEYIAETTPAECHRISGFTYPEVTDDDICQKFEEAIQTIKSKGQTPKLAIFDAISSLPGVRVPFERLTSLCCRHNVLSVIDGAHGIGHIPLDLSSLDPDFFFSNCHKWLHTPRGCAAFYVPLRNQHLIRSTVPTSHGFQPLPQEGKTGIPNPLPPSGKGEFVTQFEFVGTLENTAYLLVLAALEWRSRLRWEGKKGEKAVMAYCHNLAAEGGKVISEMLATKTMVPAERGTAFTNVMLPLAYSEVLGEVKFDFSKAVKVALWMSDTVLKDHNSFFAFLIHDERWWVRFSAQVYLTVEDFEWAGNVLREVCKRVGRGEWKG
jgi:hercynylcysteine S-oxide lyase